MHSTPPLSFTAIIPTFNNQNTLFKCIEALLAQSYPFYEIIVVDNNPTPSIHFSVYLDKVKIVHEPKTGRSFARNTGAHIATTDYIAFIDDDVEVEINWLKKVSDYLLLTDLDLLGTKIISDINHKSRLDHYRYQKALNRLGPNFTYDADTINLSPVINTAASVVKRHSFNISKGLNTELKRNEDYEFSIRLCHEGYLLGYLTSATSSVSYYPQENEAKRIINYMIRTYEVSSIVIYKEIKPLILFFKQRLIFSQKPQKDILLNLLFTLASFIGTLLAKKSSLSFNSLYHRGVFLRKLKQTYNQDSFIYEPKNDLCFLFLDEEILIYQYFQKIKTLSGKEFHFFNRFLKENVSPREIEQYSDLINIFFNNKM